ncbi:MAG: sulfite exporter TauE/SafE family protein [Acidobacteria bacterium]|nr:sulfite exporter TauE/SafE family protein [Acidobacteriota bacterium]
MPDFSLNLLLVSVAAFFGGAINSIAGGGTLLTFPSLLILLSPVPANATSTLALLPGTLASAWGYRQEVAAAMPALRRLFLPSLIGGILGSYALTRFPEQVFANLVPWLLLTASTLLVLQKPVQRWIGANPHQTPAAATTAAVVFFQFLVGIYGGYFGAGIGILMLAALSFMGIPDIHSMNGLKAILASVMNGIGALVFVSEGIVVWEFAVPMALASIGGGYLGARLARKLPAARVRLIVIAIGFGVAAYSFYKRFAG